MAKPYLSGAVNGMFKHGMKRAEPRLYDTWKHMMSRCYNSKDKFYKNYGGRGIIVCTEWHNVVEFVKWARTSGYKDDLTIDREDNNGIYKPSNCRWITRTYQNYNQRNSVGVEKVLDIRKRVENGERQVDIAKHYGITKAMVWKIKERWVYKEVICIILFSLIFSVSKSQTTDTICAPVAQMKKVYAAAAQKKVADSLLVLAERQLSEYRNQISILDEKQADQKAFYDGQITNLQNQIALYKDQINGYERLLRKERRKRRLTTFGGILTTAAATFLFISK